MASTCGSRAAASEEVDDGLEGVVRMVQQDVFLADRGEDLFRRCQVLELRRRARLVRRDTSGRAAPRCRRAATRPPSPSGLRCTYMSPGLISRFSIRKVAHLFRHRVVDRHLHHRAELPPADASAAWFPADHPLRSPGSRYRHRGRLRNGWAAATSIPGNSTPMLRRDDLLQPDEIVMMRDRSVLAGGARRALHRHQARQRIRHLQPCEFLGSVGSRITIARFRLRLEMWGKG